MFFTLFEILDIVLMTLVLGFLFHDIFKKPAHPDHDIVDQYRQKRSGPFGIDWHDFWWAAGLLGPTILLHELAHKFTALSFGLSATFHAACSTANIVSGAGFFDLYCGLTILVIIFKIIGFGFLIFVPAFVAVGAGGTNLQYALISFAGPFVHLVFWLGAAYLIRDKKWMKKLSHRKQLYIFFFKQMNMFLFILNMIPIPGFDGFSVFYHLFKAFF